MHSLIKAKKKIVGFKQSLKAAEKGIVYSIYVARDADEKIRHLVLDLCRKREIPFKEVDSMAELGKAGGIQVGTAVAAIIEPGE